MKWKIKIGLLLLTFKVSLVLADSCNTVHECISLIPDIEGKASGTGTVEKSVREKLESFGRDALIPLSKLTGEDDPNRRLVADSLIARIKDLNSNDYEVIHQVIQNNIELDGDGGWSYGALGYVGGEKSGKFLVSELKRVQSASNQIGTAFHRLGIKGLPFLIDGLRCYDSCNEKDFRGYHEAFSRYKRWTKLSHAESARQLFSIAADNRIDFHVRITAMSMIGYITEDVSLAEQIYKYIEKNSEFAGAALISLQNMKSPRAAVILASRLKTTKDESSFFDSNLMVFRDIAEMGDAAIDVGPQIMPYLDSTYWQDKVYAAITLGHIGYKLAIPELLQLSTNQTDWQQSYAAVKAFHLLKDKSVIPYIEKISHTHWYEPLREYAKSVVVSLKQGEIQEAKTEQGNFAFEFFDLHQLRKENHVCDLSDYKKVDEPKEQKEYSTRDSKLDNFQYRNPMCLMGDYQEYYGDYCSSEQSIIYPSVAVQFKNKWLTGDNRGEWGGELVAFQGDKILSSLITKNIEDIYVIGEYAYVTSGLAHLSSNNGLIYRIKENNAAFEVEPFVRLPGAPRSSWKIKDDYILINTVSGAVIFNPDSGLEMAVCKAK